MKLTKPILKSITTKRPEPTLNAPQNMCMDKGYDYPEVRELPEDWRYTIHIPSRGEVEKRKKIPGYRARHWVVERTHSWLNRFRRLLIRWEKKVENYLAMLHLEPSPIFQELHYRILKSYSRRTWPRRRLQQLLSMHPHTSNT